MKDDKRIYGWAFKATVKQIEVSKEYKATGGKGLVLSDSYFLKTVNDKGNATYTDNVKDAYVLRNTGLSERSRAEAYARANGYILVELRVESGEGEK